MTETKTNEFQNYTRQGCDTLQDKAVTKGLGHINLLF